MFDIIIKIVSTVLTAINTALHVAEVLNKMKEKYQKSNRSDQS